MKVTTFPLRYFSCFSQISLVWPRSRSLQGVGTWCIYHMVVWHDLAWVCPFRPVYTCYFGYTFMTLLYATFAAPEFRDENRKCKLAAISMRFVAAGGYSTKFFRGGSARVPNLYPFTYHFKQKRYPFLIPSIENEPLSYPCNLVAIWWKTEVEIAGSLHMQQSCSERATKIASKIACVNVPLNGPS